MIMLCKLVCAPVMAFAAMVALFSLYGFANAFGSPQPGANVAAAMNASAVGESVTVLLLAMIAWLVSDLKAPEPEASAVIASKVVNSVHPSSQL